MVLASALKQVNEGHNVLVYCPMRKSVEKLAELAIRLEKQGYLKSLIDESLQPYLDDTIRLGKEWIGEDHTAIECLKLGIAIHHGGLPKQFLQSIEQLINKKVCKVVIASPTLAQGLNLSASCLIVHSIYRNGNLIPEKEFSNVIGRVGRAFVDIDGIILFPVFDRKKHISKWKQLINPSQNRSIQSGLLLLVDKLITIISKPVSNNKDYTLEQILQSWELPVNSNEISNDDMEKWPEYLSYLDSYILSLSNDLNIEISQIAIILDDILKGSLWKRQMTLRAKEDLKKHEEILSQRIRWIWSKTTSSQRKGYASAGIGVECGKYIDNHKEIKTHLINAELSIFSDRSKDAINSIVDFAKLAFEQASFKPYEYCDNWQDVLRGWLSGKPVSELIKIGKKNTNSFIKDALTYKLVWAIEAVRNLIDSSETTTEEHMFVTIDIQDIPRYASLVVECGTLNLSECIIIKSGLSSRIVAREAVQKGSAKFEDYQGMRQWLNQLPQDKNWPTSETAKQWSNFIRGNTNKKGPLEIKKWTSICQWSNQLDKIPEVGSKLRIEASEKSLLIYSPDFKLIGKIEDKDRDISDSVSIWATVMSENQLEITCIDQKIKIDHYQKNLPDT